MVTWSLSTSSGAHPAQNRDVRVPSALVTDLRAHLNEYAPEQNDLLFPSENGSWISTAVLYGYFGDAKRAAGRPEFTPHPPC